MPAPRRPISIVLIRIKRAVLAGRYEFSRKAADEMDLDDLLESDIVESIVNATQINKTLRSTNPKRPSVKEYLYVIVSPNLSGLEIYTKGKFVGEPGEEVYYFLISAKRAG